MPTYNVQNNPYYQQWRGHNLISDLLANATQSLSAPATGPYGEKKGFFRSLAGDQTNRMNSAAAMRQQDVDAGVVPFEKEVVQENVINTANNEGAAKRQAAGDAARMQVAQFEQEQENKRWKKRQDSAERQANIADQWQNQTRHDQMENDRIIKQALAEQNLRKQASLQGQRFDMLKTQMNQPKQYGDFMVDPKTGAMTRTRPARYGQAGDEVSAGQGPEQQFSADKLKWLEQGDTDEDTAGPLPGYQAPVDIDALLRGPQLGGKNFGY
jgi:hypothetical protein